MSDALTPYKIIEAESYYTLKFEGELVPEAIPLFQADFPNFVKPTHHVIIQCENLSGMHTQWIRGLVSLEQQLKKLNKRLLFVQITSKVEAFFKAQGVDSVFKSYKTLREALVELGLVTKKAIDTDFINPFLAATIKVLEIQAKTNATPGKIYVKQAGDKFSGDISGVIGLVSDSFNGSVVISFPENTFLQIMTKMFGETQTTITKEIEDGAAELTNIIFGQAKITLNEKGYGIKTALPSVITGKDHSVASTVKGLIVVVPFETDSGKFFIEICTSI